MWVTCYTDASWKDGRGSLAYWLRSSQGQIVHSLKDSEALCNNAAECLAVVHSVHHALTAWTEIEGIQINTDSLTAISYLKWNADIASLRRKDWLVIRERLYRLLEEKSCKIQFKHVKGHQRPSNVRAYLNSRVDALAYQELMNPVDTRRRG